MSSVSNIKVSVIIPLFNCEQYVSECLISVLNQTLQEIEIICLDDNSTDNTVNIVREFMKLSNKIRLVENNNKQGTAKLRNLGIRISKGEYLSFLDGDDIFDEDMLRNAYELASINNLDISIYNFIHVDTDKIYIKQSKELECWQEDLFCRVPFCAQDFLPYDILSFIGYKQDKLYKRSFIINNNINFQDLSCCNDSLFSILSFLLAERIMYSSNKRVSYYCRDYYNIHRISSHRDPMCYYWVVEAVASELKNRELLYQYRNFYFAVVIMYIESMLNLKDCTNEEKEACIDFVKHIGLPKILQNCNDVYKNVEQVLRKTIDEWLENDEKNTFDFRLHAIKCNMYSVIETINQVHDDQKKVALWGIGNNGKQILQLLQQNNVKVDFLIDNVEREFNGQQIYNFDEITDKIDLIITTNKQIYYQIRNLYKNVVNYFKMNEL